MNNFKMRRKFLATIFLILVLLPDLEAAGAGGGGGHNVIINRHFLGDIFATSGNHQASTEQEVDILKHAVLFLTKPDITAICYKDFDVKLLKVFL